jgi:hypothetical protein
MLIRKPYTISLLLAGIVFSFGCSAAPSPAELSAPDDEALVLNLTDYWKLANKRQAGNEHVLQYLPTGADPRNPSEMITVTTVSGIHPDKDAKTYMIQVRNAMESAKELASFSWQMVKSTAEDSSCEYTFTGHSKIPDQLEIMRVIRGAGEIHSIIYHFGKANVPKAEKDRAWAIVNAVKLAPASTQ